TTLAPCVHPLRMREDWRVPPPLLCQRAACLSRPPLEAALRGGGRGEDGMLLACIQDKRSGAQWRRPTPLSLHAPEAGEYTMSTTRHIPCLIALSLVMSMMPIGLSVSAPAGQPSRAPLGRLHSTSMHAPEQDQPGPIVILRVRALVPEKVTLS